jgi:hypothetical protein
MQQHSWLYSDSFLKRAFAIWGHYMVANLIIGACVLAVVAILSLVFGLGIAAHLPSDASNVDVHLGA